MFEADTKAGRLFDILLLIAIVVSILAVILESVRTINEEFKFTFRIIEWVVTLIFTVEYILRMVIVKKPWRYVFSFYGIVDFLAVLPSYVVFFIADAHGFIIFRALRLLRVFRILNLTLYMKESQSLRKALLASRRKIGIFLFVVLMIVVIVGTLMYLIENEHNSGFTSIPRGIYWAIVTLTTVGYGDITPQSTIGQLVAGFVMILGYAIIAVPTGIVTSEIAYHKGREDATMQVCPNCLAEGHDKDAKFCKYCSSTINH